MLRTTWFALSCLAALGATIAVRTATAPAPPAVAVAQDQAATEIAFEPNTAAKTDRLPIPDVREPPDADPAPVVAIATPVEAPSHGPGIADKTTGEATRAAIDVAPRKHAHRRWQDSNAKLVADPPPRRRATARTEKTNADSDHSKTTTDALRCRQDALGGLLRSLNLSPSCGS
jgi:hypothetical protein